MSDVEFSLMEEELILGIKTMNLVGADFSDKKIEKLMIFIKELLLWNSKMNLVGKIDETFISRHILDSLSAYNFIGETAPQYIADVGSGGGLPALVLAIFYDKAKWTLIERSGKKCGFLRNAVALLGISSYVEIVESPVEQVTKKFDLVTFRAFRQFVDFFNPLVHLLENGGMLFAYKGKKETILSEIKEVVLAIEKFSIDKLNVPNLNEERHLLRYKV